MKTSSESKNPTTSFTELLHSVLLFSCSVTQEPGTKQLGTCHMPPGLPKLFKLANPIHTYPALPTHSQGNHNKNPCPTFSPCFFYLLIDLDSDTERSDQINGEV